jgi:hypothetical protein
VARQEPRRLPAAGLATAGLHGAGIQRQPAGSGPPEHAPHHLEGDRWADNITWDELQALKTQCGYGGHDAVEVYPPTRDVVNVANIRHLWVLAEKLPFAWRK